MKNLKFLSFMLFAIMSVSLISCGDDDEIGGRDTLVGKWQCTWSEGYEKYANNPEYNDEWNEEGDFTVTFNEDGTVVADGDTGKWKLEGDKLTIIYAYWSHQRKIPTMNTMTSLLSKKYNFRTMFNIKGCFFSASFFYSLIFVRFLSYNKTIMLLPYLNGDTIEAGCDEAGRGCLAGSVYAAAVILPQDFRNELLNDSKQLTEKQRYTLREVIEKEAVAWAVGVVSPEEVDEINILNASFLAMHRAIDQLKVRPEHLLIDGNRFKKYLEIPHTTVVKGDGKYLSIAAASILAKTYRDDYMNRLHQEFPYYDWDHNKGYPTKKHRAAIAEHGVSPYHRMTFNLLGDGQLSLEF